MADFEQRYRALSRQFHPDYFYNAAPAERRASLEKSSYLNDAYRTLRNPVSRVEYLLKLEGLAPQGPEQALEAGAAGLLEEVFALNEELDEVREQRARAARRRTSGRGGSSKHGSRSRPSARNTRRSCRNCRRAGMPPAIARSSNRCATGFSSGTTSSICWSPGELTMNIAVSEPQIKRANRLKATKLNNRMVTDYWEDLFRAKDEGRFVCWYEGVAINPILQAAGVAWCHGEAMSALLAARNEEGPGATGGRGVGLRPRALLLCPHAYRLRRAHAAIDAGGRQRSSEGLRGAQGPWRARARAGHDHQRLSLLLDRPAMGRHALPSVRQARADLQHLAALDLGQQAVGQIYERAGVSRSGRFSGQAIARMHHLHRGRDRQALRLRSAAARSWATSSAPPRSRSRRCGCARRRPSPASFFEWTNSIAPVNFLPGGPEIVNYFEIKKAEIAGADRQRDRLGAD